MPQKSFQIFFNEAAAQKYIKRAKQSDLLVGQIDAAKGKTFVVAPAQQVFNYLRKAGSANNIGFYEWITPAHVVYPVFDVDWYIFNEPEKWADKAWAAEKRGAWLKNSTRPASWCMMQRSCPGAAGLHIVLQRRS